MSEANKWSPLNTEAQATYFKSTYVVLLYHPENIMMRIEKKCAFMTCGSAIVLETLS